MPISGSTFSSSLWQKSKETAYSPCAGSVKSLCYPSRDRQGAGFATGS
jgi:hypothetical protein